jgi:hypothetical protein
MEEREQVVVKMQRGRFGPLARWTGPRFHYRKGKGLNQKKRANLDLTLLSHGSNRTSYPFLSTATKDTCAAAGAWNKPSCLLVVVAAGEGQPTGAGKLRWNAAAAGQLREGRSRGGARAREEGLVADRSAAEEHAHAGVLEDWAPALMTESEPGSVVVAEKRAHAGKEFHEKRQTRRLLRKGRIRMGGEHMLHDCRSPLSGEMEYYRTQALPNSQQQVSGPNLGTTH